MFFKDFVSVKRQKIKRGASQTYDTPPFIIFYSKEKLFYASCMIALIIIHDFHIFLVGNIPATHRLEMSSFQLAVYHSSSMFFHKAS